MKRILLATALILIIAAFFVFSKKISSAALTVEKIGNISDYTSGTIKFISKAKAFIIADKQGIYAISAVCTHLGCILENKEGKLVCPCHGSDFSLIGQVLEGPAQRNLTWYKIEASEDGDLTLDTTEGVSPGTFIRYPKKDTPK